MTVLAVDPGKTTGLAHWDGKIVTFYQVPGRFSLYGKVSAFLPEQPDIVVEKFIITPATAKLSAQYDALYIIGYLEALSYEHELVFDLTQSPNDAKTFVTNEGLKTLGWWRPGRDWDHAMDAARHLALYLVRKGQGDWILVKLLHA